VLHVPRQGHGARRQHRRNSQKTYAIAEEAKNAASPGRAGVRPTGGGIWAAPTIGARRRVLYLSTGNGY
jgi:hypothetical protein